MGNRLHVHIKHEIEYGADGFNWEIDGVKDLLEDAGCCVGGELNEDAIGDWEIGENEFKNAVKKIKRMPARKIASFFREDFVGENIEDFKKRACTLLQKFVDTGDHHSGYYHFSWF